MPKKGTIEAKSRDNQAPSSIKTEVLIKNLGFLMFVFLKAIEKRTMYPMEKESIQMERIIYLEMQILTMEEFGKRLNQ